MPYVLKRGTKSRPLYLGFDATGEHEWCCNRLDAIRYETTRQIRECCQPYINLGATVIEVDEWDGHYQTHRDYEIQIYRDGMKGKPVGKRWRYRVGPLMDGRAYEHSPSSIGYTSHTNALRAACEAVNRRPRVEHLQSLKKV